MSGHIRRGAKSWEIKFDLGNDPLTLKRRVRYVSFKGTKRDAEIELARLVSETRPALASILPRRPCPNFWNAGIATGQRAMSTAKRSNGIASC